MTRSRYKILDPTKPHFLTCTVVGWIPLLSDPVAVQIALDSLFFLRQYRHLRLYGYVIMTDHIHLIAPRQQIEPGHW